MKKQISIDFLQLEKTLKLWTDRTEVLLGLPRIKKHERLTLGELL